MATTPASELLSARPRIFWGRVIQALIRQGWNPPKPDERVAEAIIEDIRRYNRPTQGFAPPPTLDLAPAELRALQLAAAGYTVAEAAAIIGVSSESSKSALKRAYSKLGAKNGPHAIALAFRQGYLS